MLSLVRGGRTIPEQFIRSGIVRARSATTSETGAGSSATEASGLDLQQDWPMVEPLEVESDDELHPQWR